MTEALRKRLLDPSFTYRKAAETDIRKTFAKFRKEQRQQQSSNVTPLKGKHRA